MSSDPLVSTDWLAQRLSDPNTRVVDMRGYVTTKAIAPGVEEATYRGAFEEYLQGHIPGAVHVDWTRDIIDPNDPVPAQVAPPDRFAKAMGERGIDGDVTVVAVDHAGGQFATRLWWALTYYGHPPDRIRVLDGGFHRWVEEGYPVEAGPVTVEPRVFTPRPNPAWRTTAEALRDRLGDPSLRLIDARDEAQYTGAKRRGPRGGHIPGAIHLPREQFFQPGGGFKRLDEIEALVRSAGVCADDPVVTYCNGGVAATVVLFSLARLGFPRLTNYDGSWNEWGPRADLPIAVEGG